MIAYACGSGGVMFVPEKIEKQEKQEKKIPTVKIRKSNDNIVASALEAAE